MTPTPEPRWLLFLMQLPTRPSAPRIRLWRRLQQIGSVALRGSVYVLPDTANAREDFEWLRAEVIAAGGQASILVARAITADEDRAIATAFSDARSADYRALTAAVRRATPRASPSSSSARRAAGRALRSAQQELARIEAIDFTSSPDRDAAVAAVSDLSARLAVGARRNDMPATERLAATGYRGRTWVTRPRPGVDRMSSAWLIRRFIDPKAAFAFQSAPPPAGSRLLPFDMFGVEFGHDGDRCTFEVLARRFAIDDPAVRKLGEIVHDVDLKEQRYGHPEASVVNDLVEGLRRAHADDRHLLEHGMAMFGGLYESFRAAAPRTARRPGVKRRPPRVARR